MADDVRTDARHVEMQRTMLLIPDTGPQISPANQLGEEEEDEQEAGDEEFLEEEDDYDEA